MIDRDAAGCPQRRLPRELAMNEASTPPLFRMDGISKRYGGVSALEKAELDRRGPAASTPFSARTAPASRR